MSVFRILLFSALLLNPSVSRSSEMANLSKIELSQELKGNVPGALAIFAGLYVVYSLGQNVMHLYIKKQVGEQKNDPTLNQDAINKIKSIAKEKGVTVADVFYEPNRLNFRGAAAAFSSSMGGNLLFVGPGYGIRDREQEGVDPLSQEEIEFIIGHECSHIKNGDLVARKLFITGATSGALCAGIKKPFNWGSLLIVALLLRWQELRADWHSSDDPKVIRGGISWFEKMNNTEKYTDILSRWWRKFEYLTYSDHPSHGFRASVLRDHLKKLEQKK